MAKIKRDDVIRSISDALQYISYYHPADFIRAMVKAYDREQSPAAKNAIAQILTNSRMSAMDKRPVCQDTGLVVVFAKVGMQVQWDSSDSLQTMVDEAVRQAYSNIDNPLRASIVHDPAGARRNSGDNTPAVLHVELVAGEGVEFFVAAKGGGSENKTKFGVLNPSDNLIDWVVNQVSQMGAGWCPPGILGVGIGGSPEKALLLAKESLLAPVDIDELRDRGAVNRCEEIRLELFERINQLGIGAQGLGGLATVLDVKVLDYPTHAASLPIALIPNCAATRHIHFHLDGTGPAELIPPKLDDWPKDLLGDAADVRKVNIDNITAAEIQTWRSGETLLLSGKLLTGRDAAHKRLADLLANKEKLPVDFNGRFIYYVGPVDAVREEVVGPAGPTTATRMDKFTDMMLGDQVGVFGMIGKAERGAKTIESIKQNKAVYLIATGGAAYLVSKAIKSSKVLAFPELGMEAIHEFDVLDMPVTVAVDSRGDSVHSSGPKEWKVKIEKMHSA